MSALSALPIGLFDSGVGGLTVMREVARLLPQEDLIYLGDTARVPYGIRSPETILKYTLEAASFLLEKKIKLLIIACHTACSHSLPLLQKECPVPVVGVVESGYSKLMEAAPTGRVAILATPSTIQSGVYQNRIRAEHPTAQIEAIACPLFVPLIEEGLFDHPATKLIAEHYLFPLKEKKIEATLLACTHYPLIRPIIQNTLGDAVQLIEPAEAAALEALKVLSESKLLNRQKSPHRQFYATDDADKFGKMAKIFFGCDLKKVEVANISV